MTARLMIAWMIGATGAALVVQGAVNVTRPSIDGAWCADEPPAQPALPALPALPSLPALGTGQQEGLVVHEWGTFTSFSGPDGALRHFRVAIGDDLPGWVQARLGPGKWKTAADGEFVKGGTMAMQRMETPVLYFYNASKEGKGIPLEVEVRMPHGLVTEAFPPVASSSEGALEGKEASTIPAGGSTIRWSGIGTMPKYCCDFLTFLDAGKSHYAAARATESDLVSFNYNNEAHTEKFLFYRGLAEGDLGLRARALGDDRFSIERSEAGTLPTVFAVEVNGGTARFAEVRDFKAGQKITLPKGPVVEGSLETDMRAALVRSGLYELEAQAMVETWKHLWFGENGTRLLAILPQATADKELALRVAPTPKEIKRVFVARLEMLTPEKTHWVMKTVARLDASPDEGERQRLTAELGKLGRFTEAAIGLARDLLKAKPASVGQGNSVPGTLSESSDDGC